MGGIAKAVKKVVKGVTKVVKKVVKKVVDVGKKVFSKIGKVMGKLGPIGTIALGFIAPYAIGAMAGSSIGWVSTIGKGLQAVSSAVAAPFKMVGQAIGKGVSALGGNIASSLGQAGFEGAATAFQSVTDKITGFLGYNGGSISDGAASIMDGVKGQWNEAFGTSFSTTPKPIDLGTVIADGGKALPGGFSGAEGVSPFEGFDASKLGVDNTVAPSNVYAAEGPHQFFDTSQANPFAKEYSQDALSQIDVTKPQVDAQYTLEQEGTGMPKMPDLGGLFGAPPPAPMGVGMGDTSGYALQSAEAGGSDASGSGGASFWAQNATGLLMTEDLLKQQNSLLSRS